MRKARRKKTSVQPARATKDVNADGGASSDGFRTGFPVGDEQMQANWLFLSTFGAGQTPATSEAGATSIAALAFLAFFTIAFVALGWAFLRKKRRERLASLEKISLEVAGELGVGDAEAVPAAPRAEELVVAEREAAKARAEEERAKRERVRLEADGGSGAGDEAALEAARAAELAAKEKKEEATAKARQLSQALTATRDGFMGRIARALGAGAGDDAALDELESVLFTADVGPRTADRLMTAVRDQLKGKERTDIERVRAVLRSEAQRIFDAVPPRPLALEGASPRVVMILGVNGAGKTTTIGKLANQLKSGGKSVLLGAGDTFRAAAAEQLEVWASRADVPIVQSNKEGADPSSVLFDAVKEAQNTGVQVVLCDTAGRLHTKTNLMEELKKVTRVLTKAQDGAPHEVLLVLDGTVGQNAIQQAKQFGEAAPITGIVITKLDGTAKGGVVLGIADELKIPVLYVGIGEKIDDLRPFAADDFLDALFGGERFAA